MDVLACAFMDIRKLRRHPVPVDAVHVPRMRLRCASQQPAHEQSVDSTPAAYSVVLRYWDRLNEAATHANPVRPAGSRLLRSMWHLTGCKDFAQGERCAVHARRSSDGSALHERDTAHRAVGVRRRGPWQ